MDRMGVLSAVTVSLVAFWSGGAIAELFATTLSVGSHAIAAAATVGFLTLALLATILDGVRGSGGLENPRSYW